MNVRVARHLGYSLVLLIFSLLFCTARYLLLKYKEAEICFHSRSKLLPSKSSKECGHEEQKNRIRGYPDGF